MEHLAYPNESAAYRAARNTLLDAEMALRRQIEEVAAHFRRAAWSSRIMCSSGSVRISGRSR